MSDATGIGLVATILTGAVRRGTPLVLASLGESLSERAGVINLGVEGMMLVGAVAAVGVQVATANPLLATISAALAAGSLASIHAYLVLKCEANQVVSGFAITILGTGVSAYIGRSYVGVKVQQVAAWSIPGLSWLPGMGKPLFQQDSFVYFSMLAAIGLWALMYKTRFGLNVRAVGEDPHTAHALGVSVVKTRFLAVVIGGCLAGIGGAHLALAYAGIWAEKMTAGQGWIAVGLVVVAGWHPIYCLIFSWLFGLLLVLHPHLQAAGISVSPYLVAMLPYVVSIAALTTVTVRSRRRGHGLPAALAKEYCASR
jgi:ABC-type uncharacterized transport system permease subunit